MPIDSRHPEYSNHVAQWQKCSDFNDGSSTVKEAGKAYLPVPEGMNGQEYKAFKHRASFFNGMGRTVTGLVGAMTRVDAKVDLPLLIEHLEEDATGNGKTLQEFIKQVLSRIMVSGRVGILVDRPVESSGPSTRMAAYNEQSIVNWREDNGQLTMVVLEEYVLEIDTKDPYQSVFVPQYRELWINGEGIYQARLWSRKVKSTSANMDPQFVAGPTITPESSVGPLTAIPFVFLSPAGTEVSVDKAPLSDLCDVNVWHYMNSADLEHGRHLTSLPTPYVTGVDPDDYSKGLKIGSGTAWVIDNDAARVGMLEFTGKGLGHLAEAITEKQHQMAVLGAKLLQPQRKQVESAELARMANAGDESVLVGIAKAVGIGVKKALKFAATWEGADPTRVMLQMNTDFIDTKLAPDEMLALNELYIGGVISLEEFMAQLKVGERLLGDPEEVARQAVAEATVRRQHELNEEARSTGENSNAGRRRETVITE